MTVYADVLFLTNFLMDCLLVSLTAACCNIRVKRLRIVCAGILGGLYGVCLFIPDFGIVYTVPVRMLAAGAICAAAFCPCRPRRFVRFLAMFLIMNFLCGGILYCIMLYTGGGVVKNGVVYMRSVWILAGGLAAKVVITRGVGYFRRQAKKDIYNVELFYEGRRVRTEGFLDTGNGLAEPVGRRPVILADESVLKQLFHADCNSRNLTEWVRSTDLRCIPYSSVGGAGVFYGFLADRIVIDGRDMGRAVVACCDRRLEYGVLLNHEIILEGA